MGSLGCQWKTLWEIRYVKEQSSRFVTFSFGLINMFFQNQLTNSSSFGWVREWQALYDQAPKVWSEQKKSIYTLKFTSSFSPKLVKSLIWNSSPWSHLTPRSNNQASFIQGHLQHLDQGWHDFQGSRAYLLHHSIQLIQPTCFTRLRFLAAAAGAGAKLHCTHPLRSSCFSGHSGSPSDNWRSQQTNRGFKTHYRLVLSPWTQRQLKDPTTECRPSCFKLSLWPSPLQNLPT